MGRVRQGQGRTRLKKRQKHDKEIGLSVGSLCLHPYIILIYFF